MNNRLGYLAAWFLLAVVAFVTLAPIGFRPETGLSAQIERFAAFALIGLAFSAVYPRRLWLVAFIVLGAAMALEFMQFLGHSRHPGLHDVVAKLAGGTSGILAGWMILRARRRVAGSDGSA